MAKRKQGKKVTDETLVDIVEVRDQAQDFMTRNQNYIFFGLVVAVVAVGALVFWNIRNESRNEEAIEQMYQAQYQFERDSFASALTNPGGGYMGFLDILEEYGSTKAGNTANYYIGISYLNLGRHEAAIDYLKDFKPQDDIMPIMKYGAIGDAYSELGDMENALKFYQRAVDAGKVDQLQAYYLKKVGLLHEYQEEYDQALEAFEQIKSDYPLSPEGRDIDRYILRVTGKG
jgi:tetratricopeptide (TPR) repeat protein